MQRSDSLVVESCCEYFTSHVMHFVVDSPGFVVSSHPFRLELGHGFGICMLQKRFSKDSLFISLYYCSFSLYYSRIYFSRRVLSVCLVTKIHKCAISCITVVIRAAILEFMQSDYTHLLKRGLTKNKCFCQ